MKRAGFVMMMVVVSYSFAQARVPDGKGAQDHGSLKEGDAVVWYLGHCGYAVKTKNKLLIFDYSKTFGIPGDPAPEIPPQPSLSNGWIVPKEIKDLDVVVFVTHGHADHFNKVIRTWVSANPKIQYVFGWDAGVGPNVHSLPGPRAELSLEGLTIATVNSNDGAPGSAFLVRADGLTLFFGGDYYGGPSGVPDDLKLLRVKPGNVDLLFTDASLNPPNEALIRLLKPKALFPNHRGGHEEKYRAFAAILKQAGLDVPVACPEKPGSRFEFSNGRILQ